MSRRLPPPLSFVLLAALGTLVLAACGSDGYDPITEPSGPFTLATPPTTQSPAEVDAVLRPFRAALANAGSDPVTVLVAPGDSIAEGLGATSADRRWISVVRDGLRKAAGVSGGGFGYADLFNQGAFPDYPVSYELPVPDVTHGLGDQALTFTLDDQSVTIEDTFTDLDLFWTGSTDGSTGTFTYTVDGGDEVSVDTGAAPRDGGGQSTRIGGLGSGEHTVEVTGGGTDHPVTLEGAMLYDGDLDSGVHLWEGAASGATAEGYVAAPGWLDAVPATDPDLVIVPIGSNDYASGRSVADTKADLEEILAKLHTLVGPQVPFVLVASYDRDHQPGPDDWSDYLAMYADLVAADPHAVLVDLGPAFGPWTGDDRDGLVSKKDLVHPTDEGHALIAKTVLNTLLTR